MKALILAGGRGKRLDELSANKNKCMIPIKGKPAIEYSMDCAVDNAMDEILVVVGYRAEEIIDTYGTTYRGRKLRYVMQWEQAGLVSAIECAREALGGADFLLMLGDEILVNPRHREMIREFADEDVFCLCGALRVDDKAFISRTYTFVHNEEKVIYRLIEKPRYKPNNYMGTGNCLIRNGLLDYIPLTPIHHERREKELPDLIQCAIDDGRVVKYFIVCDKYTNINTPEDVAFAEGFFRA